MTNTTQHTPRPWLVFIEGEFNAQCDTLEEAQVREEEAGLRTDNSVLVQILKLKQAIAAPALLEALEFMVHDLECCGKDVEMYKTAITKARAALKQAKGE